MNQALHLIESGLLNGTIKLAEPDIHFTVEELVQMDCEFLDLLLRRLED